jgi:hypothetical protein
MLETDKAAFAELIAGLFAYHRQPVSQAIITVYWRGCQAFTLEQVTKAIDAITSDPDPKVSDFVPKIGSIVRALQGTQTDRSLIAWGKVSAALSDVGAYTDVVFDDPLIHLCIVDHGGWPKFCRTPFDEQSYLQHRFCESYRAYAARGAPSEYPARLTGAGSGADDFAKVGMAPPKPRLVGNRELALQVLAGGAAVQRLAAVPALAALPPPMHGEAA